MLDIQVFTDWLAAKGTGLHHRQFLLLSLPVEEASPILRLITAHYKHTSILSNTLSIPDTHDIPISRYQDYLGQQTDSLIVDARNGFHLNALYACVGMVRINGLIVVLMPFKEVYEPLLGSLKFSYGYTPKKSYFNEIFIRQVKQYSGAYINDKTIYLPSTFVSAAPMQTREAKTSKLRITNSELVLSNEQASMESDVRLRIADSAASNTISVILGPRGRGKSTLLGYIAQTLSATSTMPDAKNGPSVVTALNISQLNAFNSVSLQGLTKAARNIRANIQGEIGRTEKNKEIKFYAIDEIISLAPVNAIVFIDEVASIAPQLIKKIVNHFSHCILTGTTNGYEGSGKGFIHRVLPYLQNKSSTQVYTLSKPFRWLENDPVEASLDEILGTAQDSTTFHCVNTRDVEAHQNIRYKLIDKASLVVDENLYMQVFSLLSDAHYQTTPNDIVRTLDADDCKIAIAYRAQASKDSLYTSVIAVAILFEEGGELLAPLANDISLGKRRIQGHLTPQALALYLVAPQLCIQRYLRVNRIAVESAYKRIGIGSKLLDFCEKHAIAQGINCMSVSYGYTPSLYPFWVRNNYVLAKLGHRIDTASGTASIVMLKMLSNIQDLDAKLVQFRLHIEYQYILSTNKSLAILYHNLFDSLDANRISDDTQCQHFVKHSLTHYVNNYVSLSKMAPVLLWSIENGEINIEEKAKKVALALLLRFHQKGIHKSEKDEIEKNVFSLMEHVL
ncbi:MAG: tRNA(Met) cytidine acetyltransferase [Alphaproteobacteria bacterium]|jgi:tRNA(Met) cytidine acetyltransferase